MSTKRDLVEAHSFSRRRLVTAFVSGAPGGREVEPNRPGRMVVGGVGLAVLVVAVGAVLGVVKPRTPDNWLEEDGLVIVKESGARYLVVDGTLHLAANTTSAQLYFNGATNVRQVPQEEIDQQEIGAPLGIYGAPDSPPGPGRLVTTGWSACADGEQMTTYVDDELLVAEAAAETAALVEVDGTTWLLASRDAELRRYQVTTEVDLRQLRVKLGLPVLEASEVPARWLDLVPAGAPLAAASFGDGVDTRRSDLVEVSGDHYLQTGHGAIVLDDFSLGVVSALGGPDPRPASRLTQDPEPGPESWPTTRLAPLEGEQTCVVLRAAPGEPARITLASVEADSPAAASTRGVDLGAGVGAYVRAADFGVASGGQQFLIDSSGTRYKLGGAGTTSAEALGYDPGDAATIPASWLESFACGPELSALAAAQSPDPDSMSSCSAP